MTAINITTDIPSNINTLEKLAAWTGLALARCNPSARLLEDPNAFPQRICETVMVKADDNSLRLVVRLSLPVADNHAEATTKFWESINPVSDTVLPAAFKAN